VEDDAPTRVGPTNHGVAQVVDRRLLDATQVPPTQVTAPYNDTLQSSYNNTLQSSYNDTLQSSYNETRPLRESGVVAGAQVDRVRFAIDAERANRTTLPVPALASLPPLTSLTPGRTPSAALAPTPLPRPPARPTSGAGTKVAVFSAVFVVTAGLLASAAVFVWRFA
jgi:hypothetical protein